MKSTLNHLRPLQAEIAKSIEAIDLNAINSFSEVICAAGEMDRFIYIFGNGGSASLAMHLAADFTQISQNTASNFRVKAIALGEELAVLTALANDYNYAEAFSRQLGVFLEKEDVVFGISASGKSANVLAALSLAKNVGATRLGLTGARGQKFAGLCNQSFLANSTNPYVIETVHLAFTQLLAAAIREKMGLLTPVAQMP